MSKRAFKGQREDEEVEMIFRKHLLASRKSIYFMIFIWMVGFLPLVIWPEQKWLFWVFLGCVAVGAFVALREHFFRHFSVYVVTNRRIRQISQQGLFRKTVVDLGLDKIQSVSYRIPGWRGGLFGYGTLLIQTQVGDMAINLVPNPEEKYEVIQNMIGGLGDG